MKKCVLYSEHERFAKYVSHCMSCKQKIGPTYLERLNARVSAIPIEKHQIVLDVLRDGKTVGEALKVAGIEDKEAGFEIVNRNIGKIYFLQVTAQCLPH